MSTAMLRRQGALLVSAPVFLLGVVLTSRFHDEDALIVFRFARNLAQHGALAFNPGDPTYSLTCPAWGIAVGSVAAVLGLAEQVRGVAIGLASSLGVVLLWQVGRALRPAGPGWWLGGTLLLALDPYFVWCAAVGNELPAFLVVLMGVFGAVARRPTRSSGWLAIGSAVAVAYLLRPEAVLLVPVLGSALVLQDRARGVRPALLIALGAAIAVLPWLIFAQYYYGQFVPMTVEAKAEVKGNSWLAPLRFIIFTGGRVYALAAFALVVGYVCSRTRRTVLAAQSTYLLWIGAVVLAYLVGLRETIMANRYLVVFGPLLALVGLAFLRSTATSLRSHRIAIAALCLWVVGLATSSVFALESREQRMQAYESYIEACKWMDAHLPDDSRVYVGLLGAPAWYTDLHLLDNGIVSKEALAWRKGEMSKEQLWQVLGPDFAVILDQGENPSYLRTVHRSSGGRRRAYAVVAFDHPRLDEALSKGLRTGNR